MPTESCQPRIPSREAAGDQDKLCRSRGMDSSSVSAWVLKFQCRTLGVANSSDPVTACRTARRRPRRRRPTSARPRTWSAATGSRYSNSGAGWSSANRRIDGGRYCHRLVLHRVDLAGLSKNHAVAVLRSDGRPINGPVSTPLCRTQLPDDRGALDRTTLRLGVRASRLAGENSTPGVARG